VLPQPGSSPFRFALGRRSRRSGGFVGRNGMRIPRSNRSSGGIAFRLVVRTKRPLGRSSASPRNGRPKAEVSSNATPTIPPASWRCSPMHLPEIFRTPLRCTTLASLCTSANPIWPRSSPAVDWSNVRSGPSRFGRSLRIFCGSWKWVSRSDLQAALGRRVAPLRCPRQRRIYARFSSATAQTLVVK